jgi:hypothetical protein
MAGGEQEPNAVAQQLVARDAVGEAARLMLPLVAQHEVQVAERERGQRLLGLELQQLAAEGRRVARQGVHRGQREPQRHRLEPGDAGAPGHGARRRGQVGLHDRGVLEQRLRVARQHQPGVGQAHAAAGALEQPHAGVAFKDRELLGDRRGRELERVGDGGDGAAIAQLAQQPQSPQFEH